MSATNPLVQALLTDRYQLTMAYAYWKSGKHDKPAVFDLFFRHCPFGGEFAIFSGLYEAMEFVEDFGFSYEAIKYLQEQPAFKQCEPEFFQWLGNIDSSQVRIYAPNEGSAVFPRVPLLRVEGPLAICQLLETTLLNLINYPTLVATNAARFRLAAGPDKKLLEFGLRRAQGPDGGLTASRSAFLGGFDATSNELAGRIYGIPVSGTQAHAFIQAHTAADLEIPRELKMKSRFSVDDNLCCDLTSLSLLILSALRKWGTFQAETNKGELAAFINYAAAFPDSFLALVDTYDVLQSGLPNFLAVALALDSFNYKPVGIRLDSGDLNYLSRACRQAFRAVTQKYCRTRNFDNLQIVASNDINEQTLWSLRNQDHEIDSFGIGTNLVTCQAQPALGGVYKLVELDGRPCIKLSEDAIKTTIPSKKQIYRLYGSDGKAILDLMTLDDEPVPQEGQLVVCRHPFVEGKRCQVIPRRVRRIYELAWDGKRNWTNSLASARCLAQVSLNDETRADHLRPLNPTPYKVSVSERLYNYLHKLMQSEAPMEVLS